MYTTCSACGGNQFTHLGSLGPVDWFRCRACGFDQPMVMDESYDGAVVYDADVAEYQLTER